MNKQFILQYLVNHKSDLMDKYGVVKIGLFGSYARGDNNTDSDIDLAVEIEKGKKNIHNFLALKRELESVFNTGVDLGIESTLKPTVRADIEREIIYV